MEIGFIAVTQIIIVTRHIYYIGGVVRATRRTKHASPENDTQKHERWKYDREFAKIVTKMEKGKNLKKKEFDKIHWFIWTIGH
jgi:hypothetical protein